MTSEGFLAFLQDKLADAERSAAIREDMARGEEHELTPAEWQAAMNLHPSTRGLPMPTPEQRTEAARRQRSIADKHRREAAMYRAVILRLQGERGEGR